MQVRTLVDIEKKQVDALDALAKAEHRARASLIREAISDYLARRSAATSEDAFGLWGAGEDGLAYQQRLRAEW